MLVAFLAAALIGAAPLDARHAALLDVLSRGDDAAGCSAAQRQKLAASATIRTLGTLQGDRVILAEIYDPCICGAQNCPFYAIRLARGKPQVLLSTFGTSERSADKATPLPGILVLAHSSAMVSDESRYAYRNGRYALVDDVRVRASDNARKSNGVAVRFAPGTSWAPVHGSVSTGWYDVFTFAANGGQRLTIDGVHSGATLSLTLYGPGNAAPVEIRPGVGVTLPKAGTYRLQIENDSETDVPYSATLAIR